mmetsp:Transcript_10380/g.10397  ORF Transcript_10380/g.10397 Transcript_10380/m.10397 type:complete len:177 (-) Transcript_10380:394-924(-)
MAKLQGHFLKYRDCPKECADNAQELLKDDDDNAAEMSIDDWLHRLNLLPLKKFFEAQKIRRVTDLRYIECEDQFDEYEITGKVEKRRLWLMMKGDPETKENFKFLSSHGVRGVASHFIQAEEQLQELIDYVPEGVLTGFHLKDIFDTCSKKAEIKKKIYEAILFNKRFPKSLAVDK